MKKQSGFSLIELLLVLAIIGTISAIAIPAMLGQRARANDKAAKANASSIMADLIGSYDKIRDTGAPAANGAAIIGTAAAPLVPMAFTTVNPWNTAAHLTGYATGAWVGEAVATPGANTAAQAVAATQGQVQLGYLAPAAGASGVIATSVYLRDTINVNGAATNNFTSTANVE